MRFIVAINNDPGAPFFEDVDFGIAGDWAEVVPELVAALEEAKGHTRVAG